MMIPTQPAAIKMTTEILHTYRQIADTGVQGKKSDAIRTLCDEIEKLQKRKAKKEKFISPTIEDIKAYAREIGIQSAECENFFDHYQANGWKVGRVPMIDWKATLRNWKRNSHQFNGNGKHRNGSNGADPLGWQDYLTRSGATFRGEHRFAPEWLRIEYARSRQKESAK